MRGKLPQTKKRRYFEHGKYRKFKKLTRDFAPTSIIEVCAKSRARAAEKKVPRVRRFGRY
jgi:hypothetical protein